VSDEQQRKSGDPGPDPAEGKFVSRGGVAQFRPKTGGRLNRGGTPGHDGSNAGTTPKEVRKKLREMFVKNIEVLDKIAKDHKRTPTERMRALEMMGKYGVGIPSTMINDEGDAVQPTLVIQEVNEAASSVENVDDATGEGEAGEPA
jgi:hypothetical protein